MKNSHLKYNIIYTGEGICHRVDNQYRDRVLEPLSLENNIYINRGRDTIINSVNNIKTYNLGGCIKLLTIYHKVLGKKKLSIYYAYKTLNDFILSSVKSAQVFSMLYYNHNGLSLVFSKYRKNITLIEVQHGTMINFPTYGFVSDYKIADIFYVKNQETINYLKENLNKNFEDIEYRILPSKQSKTLYQEGKHILYASTIELNGIHPNFIDYINQLKPEDNVNIYIRLHPREKEKKHLFEEQIKATSAKVVFDESRDWLESNQIKNLIVVSPWSSVIEDAADNGYKAIILEELGKNRFSYLIDNKQVFYANSVNDLILALNNDI